MRWSRLHGDMQGWRSKEVVVRSRIMENNVKISVFYISASKTQAKFLVG